MKTTTGWRRGAVWCAMAFAVAACGTGAGRSDGPAVTMRGEEQTEEQTIERFLQAAAAADGDGVAESAAFPFLWDARCRVLVDATALHERLVADRLDGRSFRVEVRGRLGTLPEPSLPDLEAEWQDHVRDSLAKLTARDGCDDETDPLLAEGVAGDVAYFLVVLHVDGEAVPTVMRVRRTELGWRVTGLDN